MQAGETLQSFERFSVGDHAVFRRRFVPEDFAAFSHASGDENPLHHDLEYARSSGFAAPIVPLHMALAPLSKIAGMIFPGEPSLYLGHEVRAVAPIPYGTEVVYSARVVATHPAQRVLTLRVLGLVGSTVALDATMRVQAHAGTWHRPPAERVRPGADRGTAVVTGATGSIGAAIARRLAREGYSLVLVGRDGTRVRALADSLGAAVAAAVTADLALPDGRARAAGAVSGREEVSLLVHAASPPVAADVGEHVAVNFTALRAIAEAALPSLLARQAGAVVAIGSTAVDRALPGFEEYVAAKTAAASFCSSVERRFRSYGVRGLVLAFGFVRTSMSSPYRSDADPALLPEEAAEALAAWVAGPIGAPWRSVDVKGVRDRTFEGGAVEERTPTRAEDGPRAASPASGPSAPGAAAGDDAIAGVVRRSLRLPSTATLVDGGLGLTPGWDSLGHIALVVDLEAALGIHFTAPELEQTQQYGALLALCRRKLAERSAV